MAFVIAVSGKGGTGKTTISALTIRYLTEKRKGPLLAVDADSNSCLNEALGVSVHATIGQMREKSMTAVRAGERPSGMSMDELFDYQVQQSVIESKGFDLIVMGRPEGPGCYCAANNIIRKYTDKLGETYPYVVIDNEAGMEHLSRRTTQNVDLLLIISDATLRGIQTAKRISNLVDELKLSVRKRVLIINRVYEHGDELMSYAKGLGLSIGGILPHDKTIFDYDLKGKPIIELVEDSPALNSVFGILNSLEIP